MSDMGISSEQELAELIDDRSDDEINEFVQAVGVDAVLDQIFQAMQERFAPEKTGGQTAVAQWDIAAPDGTHTRSVTMSPEGCAVANGAAEAPRVTLGMSLPNFMRFIAGKLDGMQAFMSGQLKLGGDMMFATMMQNWFER
jgi:putative sterol carrier protein